MLKELTPAPLSRSRLGPARACASGRKDPLAEPQHQETAYSSPTGFARHQEDTGHFAIEKYILGSMLDDVGEKVVSLGCGNGRLDRELVIMRSQELLRGGRLRVLGVDCEEKMTKDADARMHELVNGNSTFKNALRERRLLWQYKVATLGGPSFADLNLKDTVIGSSTPDTFISFMLFVIWARKREAAIAAIADKSRAANGQVPATTFLSAEEYPIHVTPDPKLPPAFVYAVLDLKARAEMNPERIWGSFCRHGFIMKSGPHNNSLGSPKTDHVLRSAVLEFIGRD